MSDDFKLKQGVNLIYRIRWKNEEKLRLSLDVQMIDANDEEKAIASELAGRFNALISEFTESKPGPLPPEE